MKAVPTTTQNADERHVSEYSKIILYILCSTRSCYLESGTENAFVMLDLNDLGVFTMFIFHIGHACTYSLRT